SGAAGDVDHPADTPAREAREAVNEEVNLALTVEVERDLVEARGAVLPGPALLAEPQRSSPHHASSASRITHEAAMPVRPEGSQEWATSTRSPPMTLQPSSMRYISSSSGTRSPHGSGAPGPRASTAQRH